MFSVQGLGTYASAGLGYAAVSNPHSCEKRVQGLGFRVQGSGLKRLGECLFVWASSSPSLPLTKP